MVLFCGILIARIIYQRRAQAKLQEEVRNLLFEYVPMDGDNEIETVNFADNFDFTNQDSKINTGNASKNIFINNTPPNGMRKLPSNSLAENLLSKKTNRNVHWEGEAAV